MKKKLLLADDSVTIQKVVQITFSQDDYALTVVDNGDLAFDKARTEKPDLILADVFMPGKNGYELCSAVKNDPSLAGVPVLLLTGTFEPFDEDKARAVGADRWISKPFESQGLINCVEELLSAAATVAPAAAMTAAPDAAPEPAVAADPWGEDFLASSPAVDTAGGVAAPVVSDPFSASGAGDDLWDVSGFTAEPAHTAQLPAFDDPWGELPASPQVAAANPVDEAWATESFADSFAAPFTEPQPATAPSFAGGTEFDDIDLVEPADIFETEELAPAPAGDFLDLSPPDAAEVAAEEFVMEFDDPEPELLAPMPADLSDNAAVAPIFETEISVPAPQTPPAASPDVATAPVVPQTLTNDQVEQLASRVADIVIERLSHSVMERIAWEVVPDLAETMIKEEIRRIREQVRH